MGNGTKIGLVLVLILVVVVFATLLDKDIENAPSGKEQARLNPEVGKQLNDPEEGPTGVPANPNRDIEGSANPLPVNDGTGRPGGDPGAISGDGGIGEGGERDWEDENYDPRDLADGDRYNGFPGDDDERIDLNQGLTPVDDDVIDPVGGNLVPASFPGDDPQTDPNEDTGDGTDPTRGGGDGDTGTGDQPDPPTVASGFPKTHEVVEGDVLWKIAEKYYGKGTLYTLIMKENDIEDSEALKIGAKLSIPAPPAGTSVSGGGSPSDDDEESGTSSDVVLYTIQDGDTLYDIAADKLGKGSRWQEIEKLNPDIDPDRLKVGTRIKIPKK